MPLERRQEAAGLFWADEHSADQQMEAIASVASHMKFRARSVTGLPLEKKARYLATLPNMSDGIAARVLVNYHLERQRPMMAAFLDVLGIPHQDGLITEETVAKPEAEKLTRAVAELRSRFPPEDVSLYLATLVSQDPDTWEGLVAFSQESVRS